jgi:GT2 family glycosyltransferase
MAASHRGQVLLGAGAARLFIAMRREVFAEIGGFDDGMLVYGIMEDSELSVNLWAPGYQCLLVPTIEVAGIRHRSISTTSRLVCITSCGWA